ncbi:hypothetical protein [Litoribacter populi]|uniref:hypothetical protein n=1 Tax=Litoribacter populi TaxID=2598460 RepID=UPI00117D32AB|nr:hypothetical protein [Litoribacter populi]
MNFKLNRTQLEGIHYLLTAALRMHQPTNMADSLLTELVDGVNDRIRAKIKKAEFNNKTGFSLKLNSKEAKALYCWFNQIEQSMGEHYQYECIITRQIVNDIDKEYA